MTEQISGDNLSIRPSKINIVKYFVDLLAYWIQVSDCCPFGLLASKRPQGHLKSNFLFDKTTLI